MDFFLAAESGESATETHKSFDSDQKKKGNVLDLLAFEPGQGG